MNPAPVSDTLLHDPGYFRLKEHLVQSTGLAYYDDKDADFRRIGCRLTSLGLRDCSSYFDLLRDPQNGPAIRQFDRDDHHRRDLFLSAYGDILRLSAARFYRI